MASLLVVSGKHEGEYYPVGRAAMTVGRDEACAIQIVDDAVSRKHVQIRFDTASGGYHVKDLGSTNGTLLNDRQLKGEKPIRDGDVVAIGDSEIMFSALDFADGKAAFAHHRAHGEAQKRTVSR